MYLNLDSELVCEPLLPASDHCLFDYDSGLPLSSFEFVFIFNKYLHMDPTVSASPSQCAIQIEWIGTHCRKMIEGEVDIVL